MSEAQQPTVEQHHDDEKADETEPDVHFQPVVTLEQVDIKSHEEDEITIKRDRAKLFRFDKNVNEWKERGTGDIRLMMNKGTGKVRILMRREKTLKLCANHYITEEMKLKPNVGSDRSWVWTTMADASDGEPKVEMLAVRFANSDIANRFKARFEECQSWNVSLSKGTKNPDDPSRPIPDAGAAEVIAEEGSEKKKKEDAAASGSAPAEAPNENDEGKDSVAKESQI